MSALTINVGHFTPTPTMMNELLYAVGTGAFKRSGTVSAIVLVGQDGSPLGSSSVSSSDWTLYSGAGYQRISLKKTVTVSSPGTLVSVKLRNSLGDDLFVYTLDNPVYVYQGEKVDVTWDVWTEGTGNLYVIQWLIPLIDGSISPIAVKVTKALLWYLGNLQETIPIGADNIDEVNNTVTFKAAWTPGKSYIFDYIQLVNDNGDVIFGISESGSVNTISNMTLAIAIRVTT